MDRTRWSKILLTAVLAGGAVMSFILDWRSNHLLNPLWHPHARFHGAVLLFLFAGVAATATWVLWRPSMEPNVAIVAAALLSASYWTPFFFVPYLLPGSSWWAGVPRARAADRRFRGLSQPGGGWALPPGYVLRLEAGNGGCRGEAGRKLTASDATGLSSGWSFASSKSPEWCEGE